MIKLYCLDSYALWEIQFQNKKFLKFLDSDFVISDWTLVEFYRSLLKAYDKKTADYWLGKFQPHCKKVETITLIRAVVFQYQNKKTNISLFDCVGYIFSLENNFKFVTGDKEFRYREGVIFIQK